MEGPLTVNVPRLLLAATALLVLSVTGIPDAAAGGVDVEPDGTVVITADLDLPPHTVREALDREVLDPTRSPDVVRADVIRQRGRCAEVATTVRGGPLEVDYVALRCPTADGWEIDLLRSDDMTSLTVQWQLTETDGGTQLTFSIHSRADLPVPERVQRAAVKRSAIQSVERFERSLPSVVAAR